jgi:hypothetical protein
MLNTTLASIAEMSEQELTEMLEGLVEKIGLEINQPMHQIFVSFHRDANKSSNFDIGKEGWPGGVVVIARGPIDAALQLFDRNLYPGGTAAFYDVPVYAEVDESDRYRALNKNDLIRFAAEV